MRRVVFASILASSVLFLGAPLAVAQDVGAAQENICCGTECCAIPTGDGCQSRGEANPDNSCQQCDPSASQTAWSDIPGCTPTTPDAGTGSGGGGGCSVAASESGVPAVLIFGLGALLYVARKRR